MESSKKTIDLEGMVLQPRTSSSDIEWGTPIPPPHSNTYVHIWFVNNNNIMIKINSKIKTKTKIETKTKIKNDIHLSEGVGRGPPLNIGARGARLH